MNNFLDETRVEPSVWAAHPDYLALILTARGLVGGPSDGGSDEMLNRAEAVATQLLQAQPIEEIPEVRDWRERFLTFGVKHKVAKSSFESLLKRSSKGLPRVDRITDLYNAISILHRVPIGGEDLDKYQGSAQLVFARGDEIFEARNNGEVVNLPPDPGEVIWRDDLGATCRRWNWRQCIRTHLSESTRNTVFIFDGIGEEAQSRVENAAAELTVNLQQWWPEVNIETRVLTLPNGLPRG